MAESSRRKYIVLCSQGGRFIVGLIFVVFFIVNNCTYFSYLVGLVMNRGHPLFERINDLVHRVGNMGFWSCQPRKYHDRMLLRTMVRRMRVIYNSHHGLNNTHAMDLVNEAFTDDEWPIVKKTKTSKYITSKECFIVQIIFVCTIYISRCFTNE